MEQLAARMPQLPARWKRASTRRGGFSEEKIFFGDCGFDDRQIESDSIAW
jgi:hypothetical protein